MLYKIKKIGENNLHYIELSSPKETAFARICLDRGAALEKLRLKEEDVIVDLYPLEYKNTYASSILFPFANRIKDGVYSYKNKDYQFECNEVDSNNALHGLVFNQTFEVIKIDTTETQASVSLSYKATIPNKAFPYLYNIIITYTLRDNNIDLSVEVTNTDTVTFPFTIGWHPYFLSDDLYRSTLEFSSSKEFEFDERMITKGEKKEKIEMPFEIKDQQLDNCYALGNGKIVFNTPKYKMLINSSAQQNFFQMYTPPKKNVIALEPVTGISDSFNNKVGLQQLEPNSKYAIHWSVVLEDK